MARTLQVILFEINCAIFYTNLHELFCQFISWTNWENSGKFMDDCWISCQVMADMKKVYDDLIIINLYLINIILRSSPALIAWILDLIAFITPLVDLTEVVDKGLATGWSAAGLATYTVGLWWHGMPEKIFQTSDRTWRNNFQNKEEIKMILWGQSKTTPKREYWTGCPVLY